MVERPTERYSLRLLDGFGLDLGGHPRYPQPSGQRLLALLAIAGPTRRMTAAGTLWPDASEPRAMASLRTVVWRLRTGAPRLVIGESGALRLAEPAVVDTHALIAHATRLINSTVTLQDGDLEMGLLRGRELLPGWYDDWVSYERERMRQLRMHALELLAHELRHRGRYAAGLEAALEAVRMEPLRESSHRAVVALHLAEGNVVEAMRHFDLFRHTLQQDLGVQPSPQLMDMVATLPEQTSAARLTRR